MSYYDAVGEFHAKFGLPHFKEDLPPHLLDQNTLNFRVGFMLEELTELMRGASQEDLPAMADALVDLVYVALGTAQMMHLPFADLFAEVQRANMEKERGPTEKRGHHLDVRKPVGWEPPDIEAVLEVCGWKNDRNQD